jgi:superfamily I DNA/RNA helicase
MTVSPRPIKVAISADFLSAFSKIERNRQGKVLEFVNKFRTDPTRSGINYEKIKVAKDPNLRSVRIDEAYRGIVLKPDTGDVYVLLWVDHHDKAYKWAENKSCSVHPEIGSLQVYDVKQTEQAGDTRQMPSAIEPGALFSNLRNRDLLKLGVPEALFSLVRAMKTDSDFDAAQGHLPQEAQEALGFIAVGISLEEVLRDLERTEQKTPVDTNDFAKAIENDDSKRRFFVVDDELELAAILNAPLEKWRVFLHPKQRKLVERDWNGPVRVLGGAGTGKTVVALHRAKWLLENRFTDKNDRILFTTFTKNLAADIQQNLSKICSADTMKRIEVVNLDKWVLNFLNQQGYQSQIAYDSRTAPLWEKAIEQAPVELGFPSSFYREEWEEVIQPQAITSIEEYISASRLGRGVRLNRASRKLIWPVFEEYSLSLSANKLREPEDAMLDAAVILTSQGAVLSYKAIIVDEAQDMGLHAFKLIRQMMPESLNKNDIFIVGDGHQRIYRRKVTLSRAGIKITGRSAKLRINYRTTEENRNWAVRILEGLPVDDLDGNLDDQKGYKSLLHGAIPEVRNFPSFEQEIVFLADYLTRFQKENGLLQDVCLVARSKSLLKQYEAALGQKGIQTCRISRDKAEDRKAAGVRLATMHRVKGLEFDKVIIAGVNDGVVPEPKAIKETMDSAIQKADELKERSLLYVAATRAKKEVLVTSFGKPSVYLGGLSR